MKETFSCGCSEFQRVQTIKMLLFTELSAACLVSGIPGTHSAPCPRAGILWAWSGHRAGHRSIRSCAGLPRVPPCRGQSGGEEGAKPTLLRALGQGPLVFPFLWRDLGLRPAQAKSGDGSIGLSGPSTNRAAWQNHPTFQQSLGLARTAPGGELLRGVGRRVVGARPGIAGAAGR